MGNYFGIDSLSSVDDAIVNILYQPPVLIKDDITRMHNRHDAKLFNIEKKYCSISTLEIYPDKQIHANNKIIIFSHGNACDNFTMFDYLKTVSNKLGIKVCSYDYPTFGLSTGEINANACFRSLNIVVDYYLNLNYEITLVAQSIGTGVVIDYIADNEWTRSVMLISPYMSIPSVVLGSTMADSCVVNHRFDSINKINKIKCKVKILHGKNDELINISHAKNLYEILPDKSLMPKWLNKCDHGNILGKITMADYLNVID